MGGDSTLVRTDVGTLFRMIYVEPGVPSAKQVIV